MEVGLIVPTSSAYVAEARAAIVLSARWDTAPYLRL